MTTRLPRCRVVFSREERAKARADRDRRVRELLAEALRVLEGGKTL